MEEVHRSIDCENGSNDQKSLSYTLPGNIYIPPSLKSERLPKPIQVKRLRIEMQKYRK